MEHQQLTNITKQMKQALSEQELQKLGEKTGQCHRQRKVTPMRLVLSLMQSLGCGRVETIADMLRDFNRLHGENVQYKPFHNQLAKRSFPDFAYFHASRSPNNIDGDHRITSIVITQ